MAPSKRTMLFVCLLVAAVAAVVPIAQGGLLGTLLAVIRIQGRIFCSANGGATVGTNGAILTPAFANATVLLRCGAGNNGPVLGTVETNSDGMFSMLFDGSDFKAAQMSSECRVVVTTPLVSCNATLASPGSLTSTLTPLGNTTVVSLPIVNFGISGMFNYTNVTINYG